MMEHHSKSIGGAKEAMCAIVAYSRRRILPFLADGIRRSLRVLPCVVLILSLGALSTSSARGEPAPSPELAFLVTLSRDSILVGDPIELRMEASGPEGARLLLPEAPDSVGPLKVLSTGVVTETIRGGRIRLQRRDQLTAFKTGTITLPALPLFWVSGDGDTAAAWSRPVDVKVGSLVEEGATLQDLRDLRDVVSLSRPAWMLWVLIALGAALLVWAALRLRSRFGRKLLPAVLRPSDPPLPAEIVFERGYKALLARRLPESGRFKEFYGEISLLLRAYIEGRFHIPAVEETRTELIEQARGVLELDDSKLLWLQEWLTEGDLVKFAKLERLQDQACDYGERAAEWVRETTMAAAAAASSDPSAITDAAPLGERSPSVSDAVERRAGEEG